MNDTYTVDLTNCDREPIHIPGSIQPHGCLLACDVALNRVLRHSVNAQEMLKIQGNPNGRPLADLLGPEVTHTLRNALSRVNTTNRASLMFGLELAGGRRFDIAVHSFKSTAIIEFEPTPSKSTQPLDLARTLIGRITAIETVDKLIGDTSRLIRAMFGYDRVMVYRFAPDGAGQVVSEAKRSDLESFKGQYFPATDIPQQARQLYLLNTIRIISDSSFEPVPVEPVRDLSGEPLDLSFAHLRSVSPIHCEYLRNMGVGASMSISVIVNGALWGMIACHHYEKRTLSMAERVAAEMFGEFFSLHLSALKQKRRLDAATRARRSVDVFLRTTAGAADIDTTLRENLDEFASLIHCDGVGMWLNGQWDSSGSTPPASAIPALARFAETVAVGGIWATHMLSSHVAAATDYSEAASGMLVIPLSQRPRDFLFLFRKELVQTLNWAGNPEKSYTSGPFGDRLTPRESFEVWKETVRKQADPWIEEEREIAEATRAALVEVVLHHNELLNEERAKAEIRQRVLNEELNHRVKNILAVIKSVIAHPTREGQSLEDYVDSLRGRIQALAVAHDQVIRGEGGGELIGLINAELTPHRSPGSSFEIDGPPVWFDSRAYAVMALVLHELSTNAAKYGALSRTGGTLSINWSLTSDGACEISWRETGGPHVQPPQRRGFGTMLVDRSIPFDLGGKSEIQYNPGGVTAQFVIPAKFTSSGKLADVVALNDPAATPAPAATGPDIGAASVLLVEDQMLIAMDLEQMLVDAGINEFVTAASAAEALARLQDFSPDVALLDVNLGSETSDPVAEELSRRGIPFAFATGYGGTSETLRRFPEIPIVRKPYEAEAVIAQITSLLDT